MFDDRERLRGTPGLRDLLAHYVALAGNGREVWQDRLMALDQVDAPTLSRLHGELIAWGWIEVNAGQFGVSKAGAVAGCYRVTTAGARLLGRLGAADDELAMDESEVDAAAALPVASSEASPAAGGPYAGDRDDCPPTSMQAEITVTGHAA